MRVMGKQRGWRGGSTSRIAVIAVVMGFAAPLTIASGTAHAANAMLTVSGSQWGVSTSFFGATEGNVRFAASDLQAGVTTYRVYGGMSRWEADLTRFP